MLSWLLPELLLVLLKKNCGRRNELLRFGCCDCSGDERPEDEAIEEEDGDVEYMLVVQRCPATIL